LIVKKFTRKDLLCALGGGVVGDLTGFAAATFLRGIDFIQIPTTLLSQVDSSIGGKTGVDFAQYKNMVGAFHMPKLVYMNLSTLKDLPGRQYFAGMGEVLKSALLKDASFYEWLINNFYEIGDREPEIIEEMVMNTCNIKKQVVEKDPYEKGDRALLNLGHTLGHAIESSQGEDGLIHGECVALGMMMLSSNEVKERLEKVLTSLNLPCVYGGDPQKLIDVMRHDKKAQGDLIKIICCQKIGRYEIKTVSFSELQNILKEGV
jgi:3-dehydroquinate synthase